MTQWWMSSCHQGWEGHRFMQKLKDVKPHLKEWNQASFGSIKQKRKDLKGLIKEMNQMKGDEGWNIEMDVLRKNAKVEFREVCLPLFMPLQHGVLHIIE